MVLLVLMSAYSWFIIFTKWWEQRRLLRQAAEAEKNFWAADNIKNGVNKLTGKGNVFKVMAAEAIDAAEHHDERLTQQVPLHEWIDNVLARATARIGSALSTQLPFLATTGSTAPFIGLFGTVWGIYHALVAIGVAGQASIDKVAGPVGEALIMTADRPRGRGAGGARLQLPAGPQQADPGEGQALLERSRAGDRQRLAHRRHRRQGHRRARAQEVNEPARHPQQSPERDRTMGMNVTSGGGLPDDEKPMSEINTTPLVDVMLVMLIIFLITIPVITQSVKVDLPKAANIPTQTKPENINIAVDKEGNVYWNTALVPTQEALLDRLKSVAVLDPQPEIHVRGDRGTAYEHIGRVIVLVQRAGIQKVGFITEPDRGLAR